MLQEKCSAGSLSQGEFIRDFKISSVVQEWWTPGSISQGKPCFLKPTLYPTRPSVPSLSYVYFLSLACVPTRTQRSTEFQKRLPSLQKHRTWKLWGGRQGLDTKGRQRQFRPHCVWKTLCAGFNIQGYQQKGRGLVRAVGTHHGKFPSWKPCSTKEARKHISPSQCPLCILYHHFPFLCVLKFPKSTLSLLWHIGRGPANYLKAILSSLT